MRHNQNRRSRGRSGRKGPNPLTRAFESNGPDVKVRGTAAHIAEKYMALARDALSSGDNVAAENYFQHAEHYNRIIAAAQAQSQQGQPDFRPRDGGDEEGYAGDGSMNGRSMDYGRDDRGYYGDSDEDGDDAPPPHQQASHQHQHRQPQQQGAQQQTRQQQPPQDQERERQGSDQQASEPERPRRRRRPRSDEQFETTPSRARNGERKPAANGAADENDDTTHDGQAALAAFPD